MAKIRVTYLHVMIRSAITTSKSFLVISYKSGTGKHEIEFKHEKIDRNIKYEINDTVEEGNLS